MSQRVYRIGGDFELPLVGVGMNDLLFIVVPFMLSYRFVSEINAILGLIVAVAVAFVARGVLFVMKRLLPGKTLMQYIRWMSQADKFVINTDTRTQPVVLR